MRTRNLLYAVACLGILAAGVSCNKEIPGPAGNDGNYEIGTEMKTATFKLNVKGQHKTKARAIGALDEDVINRIDIFEFDCGTQGYWDHLPEHYVLSSAEIAAGEFSLYSPTNTKKGYLMYANLPAAIAEKMANTIGTKYYTLNIRVQDLYDGTGGIPMGGSVYVFYNQDKNVSVSMERFFYRVDVGEIVADFDDPAWMNKDVFVKNIALINTYAITSMAGSSTSNLTESTIGTVIFGTPLTTTQDKPYFGGLETVRMGYRFDDNSNYSCWNPSTGTTVNTSPLMNKNKYAAAGVLTISATDAWLTNTVQTYNIASGEGRICSSTNPSQSHTLTVNKSLYAMKGCVPYGTYGVLSTSNDQNGFPKLVVELSVNGKSYFYPIQMYCPMHNVAYQISRITLKSDGSNYSNFFEIKLAAEVEMTVTDWDETEISNIDVGYTDDTGNAVY